MASSRDHTKVEITSGQEKLVCRSSWCVYSMCVHLGREESWPEVEKELTARAFALGPQLVILFFRRGKPNAQSLVISWCFNIFWEC